MNLQSKTFENVKESAEEYSAVFKLDQFKSEKIKITLCGNYGATNIGDDAILLTIIKLIQGIHKYKFINKKIILTILTYDPSNTKKLLKNHGIISSEKFKIKNNYLLPFGLRSLIRGIFKGEFYKTLSAIRKSDLFVLGGGGLFSDEESNLAPILWAWQMYFSKNILMFGQSVHVNKSLGKSITKWAFTKAKIIHVRDKNTFNYLKEIGINKNIFIDNDIVFRFPLLFQKEINEYEEYGKRMYKKVEQAGWKGYILLSLRSSSTENEKLYTKFVQTALSYSSKNDLLPVFIPFQSCGSSDTLFLNKIIVQQDERDEVIYKIPNEQKNDTNKILVHNSCENVFQILAIIKFSKKVFGQRLHSLIFGLIMKVPIQTIPYSKKVESLLEDINQ